MSEKNEVEVILADVDLIITIRSGHTDLRVLQTLLKSLIASLKFQSKDLEIVMTEQVMTVKNIPEKKITTLFSSYHIE